MKHVGMRLSIGAVLGLVLGASVQCRSDPLTSCSADADCVLSCTKNSCCTGPCPCGTAQTRAAKDKALRESHCDDKKVDCGRTRREDCDWSTHYRAACREGACVAEPIAADAAAKLGPRDAPTTLITAGDPRASECYRSGKGECWSSETVPCDEDRKCSIYTPCEPTLCDKPR